jgi:hypothetical protein
MPAQGNNPEQVNVFVKGIVQDIDIGNIPADRYLTAWDIKLMDKEGQGFVLTNLDGSQIAFSLPSLLEGKNFIPLGWAQHKDILYILSCSDDDLGTGEVGSYPSVDPVSGKFTADYRALTNYMVKDGFGVYQRSSMRSDLFHFNTAYMLDVKTKDHYDGSVDIYFADGINPLRVVNTGFTQGGLQTTTVYNNDTFETNVNLALSSKSTLHVDSYSITTGGVFKFGNYIFFFKYATEDFNETHFVAEYGPVPIFKGIGLCSSVQGGEASARSDKKVIFSLSGLDTTYKYLRVGYLRWFSDYDGLTLSEFGEINTKIGITGTEMSITISGTEGEVFLTESEIMLTKDIDVIPKTITQLNNRLWGGNWKRTKTHHESLANFAKLINIGFDDSKQVINAIWDTTVDGGQYKDYTNYDYIGYFRGEPYVFGMVAELLDGTMTQAYPLWGVDAFSDITPLYAEGSSDKGNFNGIYRFPNAHLSSPRTNDGHLKLLGVKFNTEAAFRSIMNAETNNWIRFNVRSIYFVRGDRFPLLKTQGLMMHAAYPGGLTADYPITQYCSLDGQQLLYGQTQDNSPYSYTQVNHFGTDTTGPFIPFHDDPFWGCFSKDAWTGGTGAIGCAPMLNTFADCYAPVFRGYMPMSLSIMGWGSGLDGKVNNYVSRFFLKPDKYCFYSPDMLFRSSNDVSEFSFIWRVGKTIVSRADGATTDNPGSWVTDFSTAHHVLPFYFSDDAGDFVNQTPKTANIENKIMIGEHGFVKPGNTGYSQFINAIDEPSENIDNVWVLSLPDINTIPVDFCRSTIFAKYLGIDLDHVDKPTGSLIPEDFNLDIVNIYSGDPLSVDIRDLFANILSVQYRKISQGIKIQDVVDAIVLDSWDSFKNITCWRGDCFLQKTYFKQRYWKGSSFLFSAENASWDKWDLDIPCGSNTHNPFNSHGLLLGVVTENAVNTAMRSAKELNSFFPDQERIPWIVLPYNSDNVESFRMNNGYQMTLSTNVFMMKDPMLPDKSLQYTARIKYSDGHIPGSYIDGYRTFRIANYKDFDTNNGEIVKLAVVFDKLVSIQEDSINEHFVNERITAPSVDATAAVLGKGDVLSDQFRKMANFGSQHKQSIVEADSLFGVDWKRNIIWEVTLSRSPGGGLYLDAKDLSKEQLIEKWMMELANTINQGRADKVNNYKDIVMKGEGINSGYDLNTGDIYFTFHKRTEI